MSLTLLALAATALAAEGSLVRLELPPDAGIRPELRDVPLARVFPLPDASGAGPALAHLAEELEAVRPLADEFDGELSIMSRLEAAASEVTLLVDDAERELLYRALLFQGFAVHRYFQDSLATDPAAAPYRAELGGVVVVRPWLAAAALEPEREPLSQDIPGAEELVAYDEVRALVRLAPKASVEASAPSGALRLVVDGRPAQGRKAFVTPGPHRVALYVDEQLVAWSTPELAPGGAVRVDAPPMADALLGLLPSLSARTPAVALPEGAAEALGALPAPVVLAVPTEGGVALYELRGGSVVLVDAPAPEADPGGLSLSLGVGAGWLYDGNFYSARWDEAPHERATVNAAVPTLGAGLGWQRGRWVLGGGLDLLMPAGAWHSLPSGDAELRLRAHPYLAFGLPVARLGLGWLFPWHPTAGLRLAWPLGERLELGGALLVGPGRELSRGEGAPPYALEPTTAAWLTLSARLGAR